MEFVQAVAEAGVKHFIVHARKAWLKGLSPAQNRDVRAPGCSHPVFPSHGSLSRRLPPRCLSSEQHNAPWVRDMLPPAPPMAA